MRSASRPVIASLRSSTIRAAPRRFASTAPADKPRSLKGSLARLGLAFGAVYYYNTSPIFADEAISKTVPAPAAFSDDDLPTVDSIVEEKRKQIKAKSEEAAASSKTPESQQSNPQAAAADGSPAALEEEAGQQGAFNPETGEINWDCPCLGGMADGPCGEEFKTAFSCFVFSQEEPKGMDCIDKFQGMQECFKKYPDIYGAELADDEDGAPTPDFGDEQPSGAPTTAEFKSDGEPAREFGDKAAADTTKSGDSQKPTESKTPAKTTSTSTNSAEKSTKKSAKKPDAEPASSGSRMVQDVATPIEEPVNDKYWQDMHKSDVPKQEVNVGVTQAHDATAANEEIKIIEKQEAAKKKAEKKQ
ncbi:mitochondrial intermembrane space import and assembly protein 40 [Fusarium sporotrichioides]|uniref:Mitochondrial intermembrane space import and assembly protein 40 n=1 Tax=Fusarium sporotrichioides TaxID=5514 RepID=A0A395RNB3_FUSSP|nr:mitochondrial intermembrane space import and assembly protein 40 [Fusarium sporotrichioides]